MKTGIVLKSFTAKDGRNVILRTPKWEDLDDLTEIVNSIVDEGVDIAASQKVTREQETEWFRQRLPLMEKGEVLGLVAEVDGKVITRSELTKYTGYSNHVGNIYIGIKKDYRDIGIGTEIMKTLISQAKDMGLMMLELAVVSTNRNAVHVYQKVGFKKTGRIPKFYYKNGQFADEIIMVKELTELT